MAVQDNNLYFEVENSLATEAITKPQQSGIGLVNLQKRLDILYPQKHTLSIQENKETYKIVLHLCL